jgi:glutamyl-tRNA synthetase
MLRIEDLDASRVHEGMIEQCIDTMRWLGIDWDDAPIIQSQHLQRFADAMQRLAVAQRIYPCELSHKQVQAALNAPHHSDQAEPFAAIRPETIPDKFDDPETSWRFIPDLARDRFTDLHLGEQVFEPKALRDDFIVWTKRNTPSYQLAVVVDDHASGVTHVVRGRDLISSTPRQQMLYDALGYDNPPQYLHLPLILSEDGRRLAKRDHDTHIATYSEIGSPDRVIGLIAYWSGTIPEPNPMSISEFLHRFDPDTLPKEDIVFRQEDAQWLKS